MRNDDRIDRERTCDVTVVITAWDTYPRDFRASEITVLEQDRGGAYEARNLALRRAAGELVAFIDSDDVWLPHRLASQVAALGVRRSLPGS